MNKPYEILIRFHTDGRLGAHVMFYQEDGVTPDLQPHALDTEDFPALTKQTLASVLGEGAPEFFADASRVSAELETLKGNFDAKLEEAVSAALVEANDARAVIGRDGLVEIK